MAIDLIGLGSTDNDGTGDTLRAGLTKANSMFTELYGATTQTVTLLATDSDSELQDKIDAVPKYHPTGMETIFRLENAAHTTSVALDFSGFYGGGVVRIHGDITETNNSILHTTQSATLTVTGAQGITLRNNYCHIEVRNIKITADDGFQPMRIERSSFAEVRFNYLVNVAKTSASSRSVFALYVAMLNVEGNYFSNSSSGLYTSPLTMSYSNGNDDTGTAPNYGLWAQAGSIIAKNGTQPAGTTSNENVSSGAVIR